MKNKKDLYGAWNGTSWNFTPSIICKIIDAQLPAELEPFANNLLTEFNARSTLQNPGRNSILFDMRSFKRNVGKNRQYLQEGAFLVADMDYKDADGNILPAIKVANATDAWYELGSYMKKTFKMPTIGITGSVGKTTSVLFAQCVFGEKYNVFVSGENGKNANTPHALMKEMFKRYGPKYDFHIQECGGGRSKLVESMVRFIDVDAFGITMINKFHHVANYRDSDEIIYDKTSFDRYANENTFGVINIDDPVLRSVKFNSKLVTYGIKDTTADYVGKNITTDEAFLEFDIDDHNELVHIKVQAPGEHNAYNALMIFAFAKHFGLTNQEIQRGFLKYSSGAIRQSVREISGRKFYIDCFNVCSESIKTSCKALADGFQAVEGNRKIAIIGGENSLGEHIHSVNYETGQSLGAYDIDEFIFYGPKEPATQRAYNFFGNGKAVYEGAQTVMDERKISFIDDITVLAEKLKSDTRPGDVILLKGIFRLPLFAGLDIAFGTDYTFHSRDLKKEMLENDIFSGEYFYDIDGVNLLKGNIEGSTLIIPNQIDGKKVFRLGRKLCANNTQITSVTFGETLRNIGKRCFLGCTGLTTLTLPTNITHIEEEAFKNCKALKSVEMLGVEHIEKGAFKNCHQLKTVELSDACLTIEEGAFDHCKKMRISAPKDSFAYEYAQNNNLSNPPKSFFSRLFNK